MNDYYQFAILSAVVVAVYAFLYFVVHPLAKWIAIKTPNKFDDLLVKKKVISRALFFVPVIILVQSFPYVLAKGHWLYEFCEHIGNILFTVAAFLLASAVLDVIESLNERKMLCVLQSALVVQRLKCCHIVQFFYCIDKCFS